MKRYLFVGTLLVSIAVILIVRQKAVDEAFEGTTLRFAFWGSDTEIAAIRKVRDRFQERHPDIRIKLEPLPWGPYWLKMKTLAAGAADKPADQPPDIIRLSSTASAQWYARNQLVDLTPFVERDGIDLAEFYPASVDAVTWEGRIGSMPTDSAVRVYIYDKDLFDRAGVPYLRHDEPMTWEELRALARKLTVRTDDDVVQYLSLIHI